jgi:hypothetical protein
VHFLVRAQLCNINYNLKNRNVMRKIIKFGMMLTFAACLSINAAQAQSPYAIPYQAVARNSGGDIMSSQNITIRFTLHDQTVTGPIVYQEVHNVMTNNLGLFSVNLGQGAPVSGTVAAVDWANGSKYLQVEMDATGGSVYVDMGTTQLMSVPYALHAASSGDNKWQLNGNDISNVNSGEVGIGIASPDAALHINDAAGLQNEPSANMVLSRVWIDSTDTRASSIFHYYNTNTGNDNLGFGISGGGGTNASPKSLSQLKMMIQGDGKVGIGTIYPRSLLDIRGDISMGAWHENNGTRKIGIFDGVDFTGGMEIENTTLTGNYSQKLHFSTHHVNNGYGRRMTIDEDGNVGIGTNTPTHRLSVAGNTNVIGQVISNIGGHGLVQTDGTTSVGTYVDGSAGWIGTNSNHPLYFYTANGWESMAITTSGNVGIGTSAPNEKLSVAGTTGLYGNSIFSPNQSGANGTVSIGTPNIFPNSMLNVKSNLQYGAFIDAPSSSEALHVEGMTRINGEVGIGINPSSIYLLAVGGKIICTELRVQATPFPDYVFASDYKLKPLEEVEAHINAHHRLPNMPPATEVESDGMNVGGIQLKLVEKVEELTLYLLQQQKELKTQKQEIEHLRTQLNNTKYYAEL